MMDFFLEAWVAAIIERAKIAWMLGAGRPWRPGQPLKLLFAGYNGTRNTGSDVRVEEMLRQVRHVLGERNCELSVMTQNFERTRGYFSGARQVHLPDVFPPFLAREVPRHDGVVACEGSMFKSKFANALTTMMVGSLGIAAAQNKLSVGYGAEAGEMDPFIERMVARFCAHSLIITRNEESRAVLRRLGVPTELGTDTAWTFTPHGPEYGQRALREKGWDGKQTVLVVCPINPYWWPVKASLGKYAARLLTGAFRESHYRTIYFHTWGPRLAMVLALAVAVVLWNTRHRSTPDSPLPAVAIRDVSVLREGVVALAPGTAVRTQPLEPLEPLGPLEPPGSLGMDFERSLPPMKGPGALVLTELSPGELPATPALTLDAIDIAELPLTGETFTPR